MIKLSIIIPVYNLEKYIVRTLDSVVSEITDEVEVIIVNDGSSDSSLQVVEEYMKQHAGNFVLHSHENCGVAKSRNAGIIHSKGQYVYFLDGDDIMVNGTISILLGIVSEEPDIAIGGFDKLDSSGNYSYTFESLYHYPPSGLDSNSFLRKYFLKEFVISIGSILCKKSFLSKHNLNFNSGQKYGEDVRFYIETIAHAASIIVSNKVWFQYTTREDSAIGSFLDNAIMISTGYADELDKIKWMLLKKSHLSSHTIRLIDSCVIPGLILSTIISLSRKGHSLMSEIPNSYRRRLSKVNFIDCIIHKGKKGIGLYLGSRCYSLSPFIFFIVLNCVRTRRRFS